ncbi:MAG: hypothetical protein HW405_234 [Candidatus Berkelbacteria bacterium]|nr:hypothetical protein [Candidatus Berkelbacteria bacterium]
MKTIRILILEDDLKTLAVIMDELFKLEESLVGKRIDFAVTVFSEYNQVQDYLNQIQEPNFDIILLDRDCKLGGSFHVINIKKFGADKFIAISTQPEYNETAIKMGVKRIVRKDYKRLEEFATNLSEEIKNMI